MSASAVYVLDLKGKVRWGGEKGRSLGVSKVKQREYASLWTTGEGVGGLSALRFRRLSPSSALGRHGKGRAALSSACNWVLQKSIHIQRQSTPWY